MEVTEKIAVEHGLKKDEYKKICDLLKRVPNITELAIFSAMWNEHCSYKSSRKHLKKLHTKGKQVIQGPGENAGVIDIGDDDAIVFKIESHNHPSFIEPYQGAATGVGAGLGTDSGISASAGACASVAWGTIGFQTKWDQQSTGRALEEN